MLIYMCSSRQPRTSWGTQNAVEETVPAIAQSNFHAHGRHADLSVCAERIAQLRPQPSCQRGRGLRPPWSTALTWLLSTKCMGQHNMNNKILYPGSKFSTSTCTSTICTCKATSTRVHGACRAVKPASTAVLKFSTRVVQLYNTAIACYSST